MEIYLIRHTTPKIEKGVCYGQSDIELANSYAEEIEAVLKQLPQKFDAVFSSPLKRCTKLASSIDTNYTTDQRLIELNFGNWELKKWDDIPEHEIQPWYNDFVNTPTLNGESYQQLTNRALNFYNEIIYLNYNKVAFVTHSGVIRSLLASTQNIKLIDSFNTIKIAYGEVRVI